MTILREIGIIEVMPGAASALARLGIPAECVADQHQRGLWGGALGVWRSLWEHNTQMDIEQWGGWISVHPIGREQYLWVHFMAES